MEITCRVCKRRWARESPLFRLVDQLYLALRDHNTVLSGLTGQLVLPASLVGEDRNGTPFTVVGVADPRFEGTDTGIPTQLWVPVTMKPVITPTRDELDNERYSCFYLFARLKPGVTREAAEPLALLQRGHARVPPRPRAADAHGAASAGGAEGGRQPGLVLREVVLLFVVGTSAGVAAGLAGFRFVESELFGVQGHDPLVLAGSAAALLGVVLAAALPAARRAARLDPVRALRHE